MKKIDTVILKINSDNPENDKILTASNKLLDGGVVAFPTETVYGLGANALDEESIDKIFKAKGRPQDNPLIVHISRIEQLDKLVEQIPVRAYILMEKFWPGPLTLIFNKSKNVPYKTTGGLETVAIRMPNHKIALSLINKSNLPIAAPSANVSGRPSPTEAEHVIEDLTGKVDIIIDGGPTGVGVESTVLDISSDVPTILRPGGITREDLLEVFENVEYDPALSINDDNITPKSPGQKYKHYSPNAKMFIVDGNIKDMTSYIIKLYNEYNNQGLKVGIMATLQTEKEYGDLNKIVMGDRKNKETIAANLFNVLRKFDKLGVDVILAEGIKEEGIGKAIMNRMNKAAGGNIFYLGRDN